MSPPTQKRFDNIKVVVVDDEENLVSFYKAALIRVGCRVEGFVTVQQALQYLAKEDFDVMFMDYRMRGESSKEVVDYICAHKPELAKRIIFSSGDTYDAGMKALIDQLGGFFLPKPCTLEEIIESMEKVLS